jgi:hypothetical protein
LELASDMPLVHGPSPRQTGPEGLRTCDTATLTTRDTATCDDLEHATSHQESGEYIRFAS